MVEPEKPFACTMPDCGMTFTNEDHLHVHTKKHDMVLQFGCEQKAAFVADQTPTPTRFIRNCEEVGLFQDLQNVNPFDEGFKRAMEAKEILSLESELVQGPSEELHTPQMFPILDPADSVYTSRGKNITISRSSSDENGVKELTTTISKLTNEVTTISRIVEKQDDSKCKDTMKNSVSYTNNVIKIHSNVEIRKDTDRQIEDTVIKDLPKVYDRLQIEVPPMMSQKSIDYVVDSLTSDFVDVKTDPKIKPKEENPKDEPKTAEEVHKKDFRDYELLLESILKLPTGHQVKIVKEQGIKDPSILKVKNTKDLLKKVIREKVEQKPQIVETSFVIPKIVPNLPKVLPNPPKLQAGPKILPTVPKIVPCTGTLIPVSIINANFAPKEKKPMKRKIVQKVINDPYKDSKVAASRRYRAKLRERMTKQELENKFLKEMNDRLSAETAALKTIIIEHIKQCHNADDLRNRLANVLRTE